MAAYRLYGPGGVEIKETPYDRLQRMMKENEAEEANIPVNVFFSQAAGSDPLVIADIERHLANNLPFGLKCDRSMIVYMPEKLCCYWVGLDGNESAMSFRTIQRLADSVKTQYLTHKEFVSTMALLPMAAMMKEIREQPKLIE